MTDKEIYEILQRADKANDIINDLHKERLDYHSEYVPLIESNHDILDLHDEIKKLQSENTELKAKLDKAVEDMAEVADGNMCLFCCKYNTDKCENGQCFACSNFEYRGLEESE